MPTGKKRVLVFVVAYNAESTILGVLERIPALEEFEVEVLVIDDGSPAADLVAAIAAACERYDAERPRQRSLLSGTAAPEPPGSR